MEFVSTSEAHEKATSENASRKHRIANMSTKKYTQPTAVEGDGDMFVCALVHYIAYPQPFHVQKPDGA